MIRIAVLNVITGQEKDSEIAFSKAQSTISNIEGYISHQFQKSIENSSRYILLVNWKTLEAHTIGFRESEKYQEWRSLLHHFYDPFPDVEHYKVLN